MGRSSTKPTPRCSKGNIQNGRVRKNFRLPADLARWMEEFAHQKNTTVTQLIVDVFTALKEKHS